MGSVSSVNPGVADLLQTLSSLNSPVLSSPAVTSALEKAPATDIVQLSMAATQLANVDAMFGISDGSTSGASSPFANLGNLLAGSSGADSTQIASQLAVTQGLFGIGATGNLSGSLLNAIG
jgi:hypothetical protein